MADLAVPGYAAKSRLVQKCRLFSMMVIRWLDVVLLSPFLVFLAKPKTVGGPRALIGGDQYDSNVYHCGIQSLSWRHAIRYLLLKWPRLIVREPFYAFRYLLNWGDQRIVTASDLYEFVNWNSCSRYLQPIEVRVDGEVRRMDFLDLRYYLRIEMRERAATFLYLDSEARKAYPVALEDLGDVEDFERLEVMTPSELAELFSLESREEAIRSGKISEETFPRLRATDAIAQEDFVRAQFGTHMAAAAHHHSYGHFHGPIGVGVFLDSVCPKGTLRTFLQRFYRHALLFGIGGLNVAQSRLIKAIAHGHTGAHVPIASRVQHYWEVQKYHPEMLRDDSPPIASITKQNDFTHRWIYEYDGDYDLPKLLKQYYDRIWNHLEQRRGTFDSEHLELLRAWVDEHIYPAKDVDPLRIVAWIAWNNSAVHSLEHYYMYDKGRDSVLYGDREWKDQYQYFMDVFVQPYGALSNDRLDRIIPEVKDLPASNRCIASVQF